MRWIPSIRVMGVGTMAGDRDDIFVKQADGLVLQLAWLGLVVEFVIAVEGWR